MTILYKKGVNSIEQWSAEVEPTSNEIYLIIKYGQLNGKIIENKRIVTGKNIGKSNETSPFTQAKLELESLYKKKEDEGYKSLSTLGYDFFIDGDNIEKFLIDTLPSDSTDANDNLKPMKAQQYYRSKANWTAPDGTFYVDRKYYYIANPYVEKEQNAIITKFPCYIQPKVNGVRCFVMLKNDEVLMLSKEGKDYDIKHIKEYFNNNKHLFTAKQKDEVTNIIFDGELYIRGESLQNISSAVKKYNNDTPRLTYNIFDVAVPVFSQKKRLLLLNHIFNKINKDFNPPLLLVEFDVALNDADVQRETDKYIREGYEGSILRDFKSTYQFGKRRPNMTKLKRTISAEFKIRDIVPQKKDSSLGLYVCISQNNEEFEVTPKGGRDFQYALLLVKHQYIGKLLSLVFYEYTESMKPLHIIDMVIRDYE